MHLSGGTVKIDSVKGLVTPVAQGSALYNYLQSLSATGSYDDTFVYSIKNANGTLSQASVTVHITGVNDAPVVSGAVLGSATEDGVSSTLMRWPTPPMSTPARR